VLLHLIIFIGKRNDDDDEDITFID
jgi:hypothetical protein